VTPLDQIPDIACQARRLALASIHAAASGHPGGVLSAMDLLVVLYFRHLHFDPVRPDWPQRDRFVLSKGHAAPAQYAVAALAGCLPVAELRGLRKLGHALQGHPHVGSLALVETSTGSLGQGFSAAVGMALGCRHQGNSARVWAMLGDGELQEGQCWEAFMCAAHYRLANLCVVIDYNKLQSDASNEQVMGLEPLSAKIAAFGWRVAEIDGHDVAAIDSAYAAATRHGDGPTCIIAHTIKGQGVSYMAGRPEWHGSVRLSDDDLFRALLDLGVTDSEAAAYLDGGVWNKPDLPLGCTIR
jgi:transketolase